MKIKRREDRMLPMPLVKSDQELHLKPPKTTAESRMRLRMRMRYPVGGKLMATILATTNHALRRMT